MSGQRKESEPRLSLHVGAKCLCEHHASPGLLCTQAGCTLAQFFTVIVMVFLGICRSPQSLTTIISSY